MAAGYTLYSFTYLKRTLEIIESKILIKVILDDISYLLIKFLYVYL